MRKKLTDKQMELDETWSGFILMARERGFVIHEHEGVALISKHELQLRTRSETEYFRGQLLNGNCLRKLGYKKCSFKNCNDCDLKE